MSDNRPRLDDAPLWVITASALGALLVIIVLLFMQHEERRDVLRREIAVIEAIPLRDLSPDDARRWRDAWHELGAL